MGSDATRGSGIRQGARQKGVHLPVGTPMAEDPSPKRGRDGGRHAAWRRWSAFDPYVCRRYPVIINQNKYLGLKVANGSEFTAMGIVSDPNVQEHVIDEGLSIFFGPPCGILLQSNDLRGVRIPHLPPDTIMLGTELIPLQKQKHGKHICPDLYRKAGFEMGVSRRGLPCVPSFVLTDYKSQLWTVASVLLGLYGRKGWRRGRQMRDYQPVRRDVKNWKIKHPLQPLRTKDFLEPLILGNERLKRAGDKTAEAFTARHAG